LQRYWEEDADRRKKFLMTSSVRCWGGLLRTGRNAVIARQEKKFLDEWYETLQTLRDIGTTVSRPENRPGWLPAEVPAGAQADQFLHAHYYMHVIGADRKSHYVEQFETNKRDPARALREAINWWHALLEPPLSEERTLLEWAPFLREALSEEEILTLTELRFEEVCQRVWSIQDHARRAPNTTLSLAAGERHNMRTKTTALAKYLFDRRARNGSTVLQVIHYVLYEGSQEEIPKRLWRATPEGPWHIEHLGISALGELVGWALPDRFPPRNNRTSKSLRSLGFSVGVHS
jgi:hypothetical protein